MAMLFADAATAAARHAIMPPARAAATLDAGVMMLLPYDIFAEFSRMPCRYSALLLPLRHAAPCAMPLYAMMLII